MFKAITAYSSSTSKEQTVEKLVGEANSKLGIFRPNAGILYASYPHEKDEVKWILQKIREAYPGVKLVGSTVTGGFTDNSGYNQDGFFLSLMVSDQVRITAGIIDDISLLKKSEEVSSAFQKVVNRIVTVGDHPKVCLIFPGGYHEVNGNELISGITSALPYNCITFGGIATDFWTERDIDQFSQKVPPIESSLQFFINDNEVRVTTDSMPFLLFNGPITVEYGYSYGWSDVGIQYKARAEGNVLIELDGKDPHLFLRQMDHPLASNSLDYLEYSLWISENGKEPYIRDLFFNRENGKYFTRNCNLPSCFKVSFSFPDEKHVLQEFRHRLEDLKGDHQLVILNTCCTHQAVLGKNIEKEYMSVASVFNSTSFINGYVFGEYGPSSISGESILHSCSCVILCLRETNDVAEKASSKTANFLQSTIKTQKSEIESLKKQLQFFESSKSTKMNRFAEDCLGILLSHSPRSITAHAEHLSGKFKKHYSLNDNKAPYPLSRNRILDYLKAYKAEAERKF